MKISNNSKRLNLGKQDGTERWFQFSANALIKTGNYSGKSWKTDSILSKS